MPTVKACPRCKTIRGGNESVCECGFIFGSIREPADPQPALLNGASTLVYREALRVSWFLVWRSYLVYVVWNPDTGYLLGRIVRSYFHNLAVALPLMLMILGVVLFLCLRLQQWFFGQLLRHRFRRFQIVARRCGEPEPVLRLSLWDTVKIWWLVTWRAAVMGAGLGAFVGFVYPSPLPREVQLWIQWLSWVQALFITVPWATKVIVASPPHGFEIGIRRTFLTTSASA